jgi:hypothetical protein
MEATRHSRIDSRSLDIFLLLMHGSNNELLQLPEHKGYFIFPSFEFASTVMSRCLVKFVLRWQLVARLSRELSPVRFHP